MSREADELLDRCIAAAREGRDPEEILREHPDLAEGVRPLVALARELEGLPAPAASEQGLSRVLAKVEAEEEAKDEGRGTRGKTQKAPRRRRMLRVAIWASAAAAAAIAAGWGLVRMSQSALPGDRLYAVKRLGEEARYLLAFAPERRAEMRLRFADTRLYEAYRLHLDGRGLDLALLERMAIENRGALALADRLHEARRLGRVLEQAAWSFHYQCDMIGELERRATPEEAPALTPYVASCRKLCNCLELGPWGEPESPVATVERLREMLPGDSVEP